MYFFMGYPQSKKGWKFFYLDNQTFLCSRDVIFQEHVFPYSFGSDHLTSTFAALSYNFGELPMSIAVRGSRTQAAFLLSLSFYSFHLGQRLLFSFPPLALMTNSYAWPVFFFWSVHFLSQSAHAPCNWWAHQCRFSYRVWQPKYWPDWIALAATTTLLLLMMLLWRFKIFNAVIVLVNHQVN